MSATGKDIKLPLNQPQYFFDDSLVAHDQRLIRRWLPATIFPRPVIEPDRPWEGRTLALYGTVIPMPQGGYRLYYTDWPGQMTGAKVYLATSRDGFRWDKPELGEIAFDGSKANNIVWAPETHLDSPSVFFDPHDSRWPYKMIGFQAPNPDVVWDKDWGLYAAFSHDGVHWQPQPGPVLRAGDRTNVVSSKVADKHVIYTRHVDMIRHVGGRAIYRSESDDFLNWSDLDLVLRADLSDEPDVEFYGMSVFERNGWFFGLLEYWHSSIDTIETHLAISRDGRNWTRPLPHKPFIAPMHDWNRTWSSCASNGPVIVNEQMVFYFGGRWTSHHYDSAQMYGAIGYASLGLDRFCALEGVGGGHFVTVPIVWPGGELIVNADTRERFTSHPMTGGGELAVEVLSADGRPLPGFSGETKGTFYGNTHCRNQINDGAIRWKHDKSLILLKGTPIRLKFHLKHARLFTIEAKETQ